MIKRLLCLAHVLCALPCAWAQTAQLDSLSAVVWALPDDVDKLGRLDDLAEQLSNYDLQQSLATHHRAYALAKRLEARDWLPTLESAIGRANANLARPDSALHWFGLAQRGFETQGEQAALARLFGSFRWVHNYMGEFEKALDYAFKALAIYEDLEDRPGIAIAYSYIGNIFYSQKKFQESANYIQKGYALQKQLGLQDDLAYSCQSLGDAWLEMGDYDKALAFQNEGLAIRRALGNDIDIALSLNSRGNAFKRMARYPEALADYQESLAIARLAAFYPLVSTALSNIGHIYRLLGQYRAALPYHLEALQIRKDSREYSQLPESLTMLAETYAGLGETDSAYLFQKMCTALKDSLLTAENSARMSELQIQYETAQRDAKIALQEARLEEQRVILWGVLLILVLALLAGALLWRLSKQLRQRNREKELLIKEVHHRVKNNLQMLSSLLYLQSRHIGAGEALDAVREGQNRVEAMGLIHQKLYTGNRLAAVEMRDYLRELGDALLDSFSLGDGRISIVYRLDPLLVDVDTAIPLGLIINELVTNALKYAFPDGRQGCIEISLWKGDNGKLCLKVADNGVGKADARLLRGSTSFGTKLVEMLSKKLKGKAQVLLDGDGYATLVEFENFKEA